MSSSSSSEGDALHDDDDLDGSTVLEQHMDEGYDGGSPTAAMEITNPLLPAPVGTKVCVVDVPDLLETPPNEVDIDGKNFYLYTSAGVEAMRAVLGEKAHIAGSRGLGSACITSSTAAPDESGNGNSDGADLCKELLFIRAPVLMFIPAHAAEAVFAEIAKRRPTVRCWPCLCVCARRIMQCVVHNVQVSASGGGADIGDTVLLFAELPVCPYFVTEVLQAAGIDRVRVVTFGTKQCLRDAVHSFSDWIKNGYVHAEDVVQVDVGAVEVPHVAMTREGCPELTGSSTVLATLSCLDKRNELMPYSYNPRMIIPQQLKLYCYPQFASVLGTEFGHGSFTLEYQVTSVPVTACGCPSACVRLRDTV